MWSVNHGYVGASMSIRAAEAYNNGSMPLSKWTKTAILEEINSILENANLDVTIDDFKKLTLQELKDTYLEYESWHHTSKFFNETSFYSLNEELILNTTKLGIEVIIQNRPPRKKRKPKSSVKKMDPERRVKAEYREQVTARRSKTVTSYGTIKGNWFYSDEGFKKSVRGKYFRVVCEEKDFGIKYVLRGEFEKNEKIDIQIEDAVYCGRKVRFDGTGLYVIINKNKVYKSECVERR